MKRSTKRAVRLTALAATLALSLTGCCWEDYFASSEPGGGNILVQQRKHDHA